jgi:CMP-N,N'-diacetyllegionaminic acid synthase
MRVLGLVPARGGSRRLARKNLAVLGGKTLVRRALETALAARCFALVALSSDDPEIIAEADGLEVVALERPAELATDTALTYDVVLDALLKVEREHGAFDAVAIVQCTSPFTAPGDLAGATEMLEQTGAGSVVTVARVEGARHPLKLKRLEGDRLLPYLEEDGMTPSHELPPLWVRNGSAYLTRRDELEAGRLVAEDVRGYEMPPERSFDIDTAQDLAFAEFLVERGLATLDGREGSS